MNNTINYKYKLDIIPYDRPIAEANFEEHLLEAITDCCELNKYYIISAKNI